MNGNGNKSVGKAIVSFIFSGLSIILGIVETIAILVDTNNESMGFIAVIIIVSSLFFIIGAVVYLLSGLIFLKSNKPNNGSVILFTLVNLLASGLWLSGILGAIIELAVLGDKISYFGGSVVPIVLGLLLSLVAFSINIVFSIWLINYAVAYAEREAIISNREVESSREQIYKLNQKLQQLKQLQQQDEDNRKRQQSQGCIEGICGVAQGTKIPMSASGKVVIGRNPTNCNFIIDYPQVSNVHCSISYNPNMRLYTVIDYSSNGTYVNNIKLQKDVQNQFPAGTIVTLADGKNQIRLT